MYLYKMTYNNKRQQRGNWFYMEKSRVKTTQISFHYYEMWDTTS